MAGGEKGVEKVIEIIKRDFINSMQLTGAQNIAQVQEFGARLRLS
jgi:L-lactate dehydrogenase (cytochrome)